jgi:cyclic-di-GMP-binding protein
LRVVSLFARAVSIQYRRANKHPSVALTAIIHTNPDPPANQNPGTDMPSFDVVSEIDKHELTNAIDQANRELTNRFDFRGTDARFQLEDATVAMTAPSEFQLQQMLDILRQRLTARSIDVRCLDVGAVESNLSGARQKITVKQGVEQALGKKIIARLKEAKLKVDAQINGDKLRINGKKRDDLQAAIAELRKGEFEMPLQFNNFRD